MSELEDELATKSTEVDVARAALRKKAILFGEAEAAAWAEWADSQVRHYVQRQPDLLATLPEADRRALKAQIATLIDENVPLVATSVADRVSRVRGRNPESEVRKAAEAGLAAANIGLATILDGAGFKGGPVEYFKWYSYSDTPSSDNVSRSGQSSVVAKAITELVEASSASSAIETKIRQRDALNLWDNS